jgi:hypothetical protein
MKNVRRHIMNAHGSAPTLGQPQLATPKVSQPGYLALTDVYAMPKHQVAAGNPIAQAKEIAGKSTEPVRLNLDKDGLEIWE